MTGDLTMAGPEAGNEAGFTLVELLVALALFSLLAMLLFDKVHFGLQAWQRGGAHAENLEHNLASQDLLRRMIGNIYPMLVPDSGVQPRIDFEGGREAIGFLGNAPIVTGGGGRFRFKVFAERRQGRTDLVMSSAPELGNPQDSAMTNKTALLSDIDGIEFSYLGGVVTPQGAPWQDSWIGRTELPRLVRIRVGFHSGDARSWPELLIAPRITADVSCVYDPVTLRCRGR
jgi:general secretion pathway protein J